MAYWRTYQPGMPIVGRRIRVAGVPGQYNEVQNVFDHQVCRVPAGLEGKCESEIAAYARLSFRRTDGGNYSLWSLITNLARQNVDAGSLVCTIHPSRLRAIEVEE